MSILFNHINIKPSLGLLNLPLTVRTRVKEMNTNLRQLSINMGRSVNYLHKQLHNNDQPISVLILLSLHLQTNLFEPYLTLLPASISATAKERELQNQVIALQAELQDVKKERDIYKAVVMK